MPGTDFSDTDLAMTDTPPGTPAQDANGRSWPTSAIILVTLLAVTSLVTSALWVMGNRDPVGEIRAAAITFATQLTTWDAAEGLDQTTAALRELGTGDFLDEVDDVLGGDIRATAEALGARSVGEVIEVFANEDGIAVVIVDQSLTVAGQTRVQEQIARLELLEVDGVWKIARVELLNAPVPLEEGAP